MQKDGIVEGISTAAAIRAAGCVGVAVAMGRLEIAVLVSLFTFLIFYFITPFKKNLDDEATKNS